MDTPTNKHKRIVVEAAKHRTTARVASGRTYPMERMELKLPTENMEFTDRMLPKLSTLKIAPQLTIEKTVNADRTDPKEACDINERPRRHLLLKLVVGGVSFKTTVSESITRHGRI
jgi:uncharacterized protein with von Willebrand factor type A (vWA) domain